MTIRASIANSFIGIGRSIGNTLGLQLAVELSDHSIKLQMEQADKNARAWDPNLYRKGNVFVSGYANPIKPRVEYHENLENPNTLALTEGDGEIGTGVDDENKSRWENGEEEHDDEEEEERGAHVQLISSGRYRDYMRQDLISQLLTPDAQWKLIAYAVIGIGILQFVTIIITLYATGSF